MTGSKEPGREAAVAAALLLFSAPVGDGPVRGPTRSRRGGAYRHTFARSTPAIPTAGPVGGSLGTRRPPSRPVPAPTPFLAPRPSSVGQVAAAGVLVRRIEEEQVEGAPLAGGDTGGAEEGGDRLRHHPGPGTIGEAGRREVGPDRSRPRGVVAVDQHRTIRTPRAPRWQALRCARTGRAPWRRRPGRRATRTTTPSRGRSSARAPFGATRVQPAGAARDHPQRHEPTLWRDVECRAGGSEPLRDLTSGDVGPRRGRVDLPGWATRPSSARVSGRGRVRAGCEMIFSRPRFLTSVFATNQGAHAVSVARNMSSRARE